LSAYPSNPSISSVPANWHAQQLAAIASRPPFPPPQPWPDPLHTAPPDQIEARITAAMDELRDLYECGEIEWTDLSPRVAYELAFLDD
jgi:hypothetical protein